MTVFAAVIVTLQVVPDTLVQPDHDLKIASAAGVAVSVTASPFGSIALQSPGVAVPHAIPAPATDPLPFTATLRGYVLGSSFTVSVFADVIVTVQLVPDTLLQPVHDLKRELASGLAVSTTVSPFANVVPHGTPDTTAQVKPPVSAKTVPPPPPVELSVSGYRAGWNVAVTVFAKVMETVQLVPDTLVQPDQDLKIQSGSGAATTVMLPPFATCSLQSPVDPVVQEIPVPLTVPLPETTVFSV